jgi:hypothetical protein
VIGLSNLLSVRIYGSVQAFVYFLKSTRDNSVVLDDFIVAFYIWMGRYKQNVPTNQESKVRTTESKNKSKKTKECLKIYQDWIAKDP